MTDNENKIFDWCAENVIPNVKFFDEPVFFYANGFYIIDKKDLEKGLMILKDIKTYEAYYLDVNTQ